MRIWVSLIMACMVGLVSAEALKNDKHLNTAANVPYLSAFEKEVIYEINLFRSNPAKYAENYIDPLAKYYDQKIIHYPGDKSILSLEGIKALYECVRELKKENPLPLLYPNKALSFAASDHRQDQGKTGKTGHAGSDGSNMQQRIERYGMWQKRIAENIAYGNTTARQVLIFLLIDDGVKNRGHRKNLLHPAFHLVGVSFGSHPVYETMCVMEFAGGVIEKK